MSADKRPCFFKQFFLMAALPCLLAAQNAVPLSTSQTTTITLGSSANPSTFGAPLTLTASVTNSSPTGHVTFFDGVNILAIKPVSSGISSISTTLLSAGSHKLTAYYRDDTNFQVSTSNALTQSVKANAGGALVAQSPIALPSSPSSEAVGDFNGDGKADLAYFDTLNVRPWWQVDLGVSSSIGSIVVWNRTDCCGDRLTNYWVFVSDTPFAPTDTPDTLQNRAGTFAGLQTFQPNPSTTIPVNAAGRYVRVQLSSANYLSLAEVQVFGMGTQAGTNLALGKAASQSSTLPGYPGAVAASAVDGNTDGNFLDGSVTTTMSVYVVTVLLGKGDGTFQPPVNYAIGPDAQSIATGDFNQDGNTDLAVFRFNLGASTSTPTVSILPGNGDGTFRSPIDSPAGDLFRPAVPNPLSMVVGDFNGDGKADIVVGTSFEYFPPPILYNPQPPVFGAETNFLPGNGDGTFGVPVSYGNVPTPFVMADFNGDGKPDLAGGTIIVRDLSPSFPAAPAQHPQPTSGRLDLRTWCWSPGTSMATVTPILPRVVVPSFSATATTASGRPSASAAHLSCQGTSTAMASRISCSPARSCLGMATGPFVRA